MECSLALSFNDFKFLQKTLHFLCVVSNIWQMCLSAHVFMSHLLILLPYLTYFAVLVVMMTMQRVASRHQPEMFSDKEISASVFDLACFVMMYWATPNDPIEMCKLTWKKLFWKREKDSPGVKESLKIIISLLDMWITWPMRSHGVIVSNSASRGSGGIRIYSLFMGKFSVVFPLPYSLSAQHQETF